MDESINEPVTDTNIMDKVDDEEKPFTDGFSQSSNISLFYQNTDTEFPNLNEERQAQGEEFENDKSRFENVDYSHTDLNLPVINNLHYNVDKTLMNIKQEVEVDQENSERFNQNDHFYLFKNSDIQDIDNNVNGGMLIETMKIKEEIMEHQGQTLIETFCSSDGKYESKFEITNLKTERNGSEIKTDNSELEFENNNIDENSCANIKLADLKSENVPTTYGKLDSDGNLETKGLSIDSHASMEDNSSDGVIRKSNIDNSLLTDNKCNFETGLKELNIIKCTSQNEAIYFTALSTDSITDSFNTTTNTSKLDNCRLEDWVDFQPIIVLKRLPDTVFKEGSQVYTVHQKDICASTNTFPLSHDNCFSEESDELKKKLKKASDVRPYVRDTCKAKLKLQSCLNKDIVVHKTDRPHRSCSFKPVKSCKFCGSNQGALNDCNMCNVCGKDLKSNQVHPKHMISQGFKTASNLRQHMISVSTNRPHQCGLCNKGFKTVTLLRLHMICHSTERPHQCNVCNKQFKTVAYLRRHMICHSTERPHQCNLCNKGFKTVAFLRQHLMSHSTERPHQCNVCNKGFKTAALLREHMVCHSTERPHHCNVCNKGFKTVAFLRRHMICHSTERPHQCYLCNKGFKTVTLLRRHMICHSTERPHLCNVCNKGFKTAASLRLHIISHSTERPHQCIVCDDGFKTAKGLRRHIIRHSTERRHQCSVCGKIYKAVRTFRQHMAIHSTVPPYQCVVCNKGFNTTYRLRRHVMNHSTERPHRCSVCNKGFKCAAEVRLHMISHSIVRPHHCSVCNKAFKCVAVVRQHMISHSTLRPHQCSVCNKAFKSVSDLRQHMISHSTERPHQCSVCNKGFKMMAALRKHMMLHSTLLPHQGNMSDKGLKEAFSQTAYDQSQYREATSVQSV